MKLNILRTKFFKTHTIGQLYIDGEYFCFVLEDVVREVPGKEVKEWKVHGQTAIPTGTYDVVLQDSPRFGPDTISLLKVPGFSFIRIHSGNDWDDTEGCPILGFKLTKENIIAYGTTKQAVKELKEKIKKAVKNGDKVTIQVSGIA